MAINLTQAATAAAQLLGVLDSGESLSTTQLNDSFGYANRLLLSWFQEQSLSLTILIQEQIAALNVLIDQQFRAFQPAITGYTLSGGAYTKATFGQPTYVPGTAPQFVDNVSNITLPNGYERALCLVLAIEMAPYWQTVASADLVRQAAEARTSANPVPRRMPIPGTSGQGVVPAAPDAETPASVGG